MLNLREVRMNRDERPVEINISGIHVAGVGGLGLVAMAIVVAIFLPAAGVTMGAGVIGGAALAVGLIAFRRRHKAGGPTGDDPAILFRDAPPEAADRAVRPSRLDPRYSTL
jgi:hypothetical protein